MQPTQFSLKVIVVSLLMTVVVDSHCQYSNRLKDGLKTYLSPDSSTYLRLNFVSQVWVRFNESNPGSTVNDQYERSTFDVGLRRTRFVLTGQLTDRIFIFVQFGQNNFSYLSARKSGAFLHDVTGEYAFVKKKLSIGFGLHGWNGLGRYSNSSVSTILALDPPIFQETTNDINDQFVRKLGVYAKGKLGKLDYRISASTPFVTQTASSSFDALSSNSSYSTQVPKMAYQGYFMYQFINQESNLGPGTVGTYLGKKKVFNIGTGFVYQDQAMWSKTISNDTVYHAMNLWGVDIYYDSPLNPERKNAITLYAGFFNYNFGKGYIRNVGPMNPATGTKNGSFNGAGNAIPLIGTGQVLYLQSGYKFKNDLLGDAFGTLQPYMSCQYANYDRLKDPMIVFDVGVNWLIMGHGSKFTLDYQNRPIFNENNNGDLKETTRRTQWVLQYQISF